MVSVTVSAENKIIDGKAVAASVKAELKSKIASLQIGLRKPGLAVIIVGDDPASHYYVASKQKACGEVGIESFKTILPGSASRAGLESVILAYNQDQNVDGILLQLPLPSSLRPFTQDIIDLIDASKDADGLTNTNLGRVLTKSASAIYPCTPKGCMVLLDTYKISLESKKVLVIGRSELVGKPIALMLNHRNATVTMAHSRTQNLAEEVASADILVVAIGQTEFVQGDWIKPGAVVIDVGINAGQIIDSEGKSQKKLFGDVEYSKAFTRASLITPVPGGVGPMTVAMLLQNTFELYQRRISDL